MSDDGEFDPRHVHFGLVMAPEDAEARQRHRMQQRDFMEQIEELLDALTPAQLVAVRLLLNAPRKMLIHVDGRAHSILRRIHHVDPETGLTEAEIAEQELLRTASTGSDGRS